MRTLLTPAHRIPHLLGDVVCKFDEVVEEAAHVEHADRFLVVP